METLLETINEMQIKQETTEDGMNKLISDHQVLQS